jgi:proteasome lid subunit RPN8/RPN11
MSENNKKKNFENRLKDFSIEVENDKVTLSFKLPKEGEGKKVIPLDKIDLKEVPMIIPEKYRIPEEKDDHKKEEVENPVIRDYFMGDTIEIDHEVEPHETSIKQVVTSMNNNTLQPKARPIRVRIAFKAYIKIALHALKYAHPDKPQPSWVEVIGLLTGFIENPDNPDLTCLNVQDAHPIGHGDAVTAQIQDPNSVVKVFQEKEKNHQIIGWYHSHPSYSPFMSNTDFGTQLRYQKLAKTAYYQQPIALVIDPTEITDSSFGFKIFRLKEDFKTWDEPKFEVIDTPVKTMPEMIKTLLPLTIGRAVFLEYE